MNELAKATAHRGDPCEYCDVAHDDVKVGACRARECDVLGCVQPKDDRYVTTGLGGGIGFTWCKTHGQLYDRTKQLRKRASHSLAVASALGVVA